MHFSFGGDHGGVGRDGIFFFWRGAWRRRRGRQDIFGGKLGGGGEDGMYFILARWADFVFGSGTEEVIRHRRRDLRVDRLPLRLFGSDRNDDSQFSSRLALRR